MNNLGKTAIVGGVALAGGATAYAVGHRDLDAKRAQGVAWDAHRDSLPSSAQRDYELLHPRPLPFGRELEWGMGTAVTGVAAAVFGSYLLYGSKAASAVVALGAGAVVFGLGGMVGAATGGFIHNVHGREG